MENQKIINLTNTPIQPTNFKTKKWVKINNKLRELYNEDNQIS